MRDLKKKGSCQMISNWNHFPSILANEYTFSTPDELRALLAGHETCIARGAGLSYGDASLARHILSTSKFNQILSFDPENGMICCQAGCTLDAILREVVPHGWFLPVTPGTKFVTVGGAIAADVHGKNHHKEGSFSKWITNLTLMDAGGKEVSCSPEINGDLFRATSGGMGLTGVILTANLKLKRIETSFITQSTHIASNLDELLDLLQASLHYTYSVAWIDSLSTGKDLGRGILMNGEHTSTQELSPWKRNHRLQVHASPKINIPVTAPGWLLNKFTVGAFNNLYFLKRCHGKGFSIHHYDRFFYPLDHIKNWNRLYGPRGFVQYQFVVPMEGGDHALREVLTKMGKNSFPSFLSVLKIMGQGSQGLSFPIPGYTLAMDFPIRNGLNVMLQELDQIVALHGGRIYLAKDARMSRASFLRGYPEVPHITKFRRQSGAQNKFHSLLSDRLLPL